VTAPEPLVSIITPCHNGLPYLADLLASVRAQTRSDWEHIVVDDGSSDGSMAVVEAHAASDPRLRVIGRPRGGVAAARNAGYAVASPGSKYVYFLDADDVLEPDMLESMISYLNAHPAAGVAFCDYTYIDEQGMPQPHTRMPRLVPTWLGARELPLDDAVTPLVSVYCWAPVMESLSVVRRAAYDESSGWDASVGQGGEGVDLFTEIALRHEIHFVNRQLYRYRRHRNQASFDLANLLAQDIRVQTKWRDRRDLSADQRARIEAAQRFRAGRLRLHAHAGAGRRYLASGQLRHAAHCYLEVGRTIARMLARRSPWPAEQPASAVAGRREHA
jgi:glycosyltransferase involved in cell wall biosynthesis